MDSRPRKVDRRIHVCTLLALIFSLFAGGLGSRAEATVIEISIAPSEAVPPKLVTVEIHERQTRTTSSLTIKLEGRHGQAEVPLEKIGPSTLRAKAEGFWSPATDVPLPLPDLIRLRLWSGARLEATLRSDERRASFESAIVTLTASEEHNEDSLAQPKLAELECVVESRRVAGCLGPAGTWDAKVRVGDYTPIYVWRLRLKPQSSLDLGSLKLLRGGSLFGQLAAEGALVDPETARVELRPLADRGSMTERQAKRFGTITELQRVNPWGYFQFTGVAEGAYEIVARQSGFPPVSLFPVNIALDTETVLEEPLVLQPAARASVEVRPSMDPYDAEWQIRLFKAEFGTETEIVAEGSAEAGLWRSSPLARDSYSLQVLDSRGNSFHRDALTLAEDLQLFVVDLDLVRVTGQVLLGEGPLAAKLWFGGRNAGESIECETDEEGMFMVVLPREGGWSVDLSASNPTVMTEGIEVEVEPDTSGSDDVLIELPDTVIAGEVVDEQGAWVPEARVQVLDLGGRSFQRAVLLTDKEGHFELHGQDAGVYTLEATDGSRQSSLVTVTVVEDTAGVGPTRLVLGDVLTLSGRIVSQSGPVPFASILAFPIAGGSLTSTVIPQTNTDADGSFSLDLPGRALSARIVVAAPGYSLHVSSTAARLREPLHIELISDAGVLNLQIEPERKTVGRLPLVVFEGEALDVPMLSEWARASGVAQEVEDLLRIPAMPPGSYRYCMLSVEETLLVLAGAAVPRSDVCSDGYLPLGGELTLPLKVEGK